jgi:hypothetical protein
MLYMVHILHICIYYMHTWHVMHMRKITCTQPQQPIQTDIGATHVTQDEYNILTHNKQQKTVDFDKY